MLQSDGHNLSRYSLTEEVSGEGRVHLLALDGAAGVAVLAVLLARRRRLPQDLLHLNRATYVLNHATYVLLGTK